MRKHIFAVHTTHLLSHSSTPIRLNPTDNSVPIPFPSPRWFVPLAKNSKQYPTPTAHA